MSTLITFITIIHIIQSYIDCVNIHITSNSHDMKEDMEDIAAGGGQGEPALTQGRGGQLWPTDWIVVDAGIVIALCYTIYDIV